ncbi:MAG: LamB/YcsF family protein [Firmicutes bacterium]|nr:LamB/YcsF family protein [Bacillota bacterium]
MGIVIDLNCDMGESYGVWERGQDAELAPWVTSANVACGFHAGDPLNLYRTILLCRQERVSVGAHVSYPDRVGFGRRHLRCTEEEIYTDTLYQLGALGGICRALGMGLSHLKPHGALYHDALVHEEVATALVRAARSYDPDLFIYAPPGSLLAQVAEEMGIRVAAEAFLDRAYRPDGTLVPRSEPGALITDPGEVARRAVRLATEGTVAAVDGSLLRLSPRTLCIHSDTPGAPALARAAAEALIAAGVDLAPPWWR